MRPNMHKHAARRLFKRDDPPTLDVDVLEVNDLLEKRGGVATVFSVVYVTASATFSGPTAGFVTLSATQTSAGKDAKTTTSSTSTSATSSSTSAKSTASSSRTTSSVSSSATSSASSSSASSSAASASSAAASSSSAAASSTSASALVGASTAKAQVTSSSTDAAQSSGISTGASAGIALVVIAVVGVLAGLAYFCIRKKKNERKAAAAAENQDDEKRGFISKSPSTNNVPQPPAATHSSDAAPRISYRPGSQFAPNVLGDAEKAAAGAAAGGLLSHNATHDPSNPFGIHAQTVDQPREMISPIPEERSLSPPVELQGSPVPSPTAASFSVDSPSSPSAKAEVATAAAVVTLPAIATVADAADPPTSTVHRVQLEFKPSMDDELELKVGQIVRLLHEYDDGWALCIRMDRSQQGVAPRTCLSKLPLKPRPLGPPPAGAKKGGPRGPPRAGPMGPPRLGPGPKLRQPGPPPQGRPVGRPAQSAQPAQPAQSARPAAQPAKASSPTLAEKTTKSTEPRQRSMSVSSPTKPGAQSPQMSSSPAERVIEAHRRSVSMGSLVSANKPVNLPAGSSPLGVPARKPVPGQAL